MGRLDTSSNLYIQDKQGRTVLHLFAEKFPAQISANGSQIFLKIMKDLVSHSSISVKDVRGFTALHIIANNYNKNMLEHCQKILIDLLTILASNSDFVVQEANLDDIVEYTKGSQKHHTTALLNHESALLLKSNFCIVDSRGRTILHILADKFPLDIPQHNLKGFLETMQYLGNSANTNIQDNDGHTVLHKLLVNYDRSTHEPHQSSFWDLIKNLSSSSNMNVKDKLGQTVLHHLASKLYWDPDLGHDFESILCDLTTFENVNEKDNNSVTLYTWILRGKFEHQGGSNSKTGVFLKIEKIFCEKKADVKVEKIGLIRQSVEYKKY